MHARAVRWAFAVPVTVLMALVVVGGVIVLHGAYWLWPESSR